MNNDTIKAVAEAIEAEALAIGKENFSPDSARPKTERLAKAAIEAMHIREMTVGEIRQILQAQSVVRGANNEDIHYKIDCLQAVKALAKLGTIKIVGDV